MPDSTGTPTWKSSPYPSDSRFGKEPSDDRFHRPQPLLCPDVNPDAIMILSASDTGIDRAMKQRGERELSGLTFTKQRLAIDTDATESEAIAASGNEPGIPQMKITLRIVSGIGNKDQVSEIVLRNPQ